MEKSVKFNLTSKSEFYVPLAFRNDKTLAMSTGVVLAADVGGTKTNLALFQLQEKRLLLLKEKSYSTKRAQSFMEIVHSFHNGELPEIDAICLGVAGPVNMGKVLGTNFSWAVDEKELKNELGVKFVSVINDMEANAYGLAVLQAKDIETIKEGSNVPGNAAIISPGTGLGEVGLYWDGTHFNPFATEGGHSNFSPKSEFDFRFWRFLNEKYGPVSWERILSGPGIYNIYQFLVHDQKLEEPEWFKTRILQEDPAAVISSCAVDGNLPVCREAIELFIAYLAVETAQIALKFKATGGIYIGGGIVPKIIKTMDKDLFSHNFVQSDRMNALLEMIPIKASLNEKTAMYGAAFCAAMSLR